MAAINFFASCRYNSGDPTQQPNQKSPLLRFILFGICVYLVHQSTSEAVPLGSRERNLVCYQTLADPIYMLDFDSVDLADQVAILASRGNKPGFYVYNQRMTYFFALPEVPTFEYDQENIYCLSYILPTGQKTFARVAIQKKEKQFDSIRLNEIPQVYQCSEPERKFTALTGIEAMDVNSDQLLQREIFDKIALTETALKMLLDHFNKAEKGHRSHGKPRRIAEDELKQYLRALRACKHLVEDKAIK